MSDPTLPRLAFTLALITAATSSSLARSEPAAPERPVPTAELGAGIGLGKGRQHSLGVWFVEAGGRVYRQRNTTIWLGGRLETGGDFRFDLDGSADDSSLQVDRVAGGADLRSCATVRSLCAGIGATVHTGIWSGGYGNGWLAGANGHAFVEAGNRVAFRLRVTARLEHLGGNGDFPDGRENPNNGLLWSLGLRVAF